MGHLGLTPQTATALGGYKAQGKTAKGAIQLCEEALALQSVGCFAIVFEAVPAAITERSSTARDPHDRDRRRPGDLRPGARLPRPARHHHRPHGANSSSATPTIHETMVEAVERYGDEVRSRHFPEPDHVYGVEPAELDAFRATSTRRAWPRRRPGSGSRCLAFAGWL